MAISSSATQVVEYWDNRNRTLRALASIRPADKHLVVDYYYYFESS